MKTFTIGQVASLAGIGRETVRFYERKGLIAAPPRRASGYRDYPPEAIARLKFIRRAKELGFSLQEIAELLALRVDRHTTCADIKARAEEKIADMQDRIRTLQNMQRALRKLADTCHSDRPTDQCPILETLETGD